MCTFDIFLFIMGGGGGGGGRHVRLRTGQDRTGQDIGGLRWT